MNKLLKIIIVVSALLISWNGYGQSPVKEAKEYKHNLEVYKKAKKYSDVAVAKNALYNLIVLDPDDTSLLDSLVFLYFDYNQYAPSLLVSLDILKKNPDNQTILEISAVSYENLQLYDKALAAYESLYLKNNDLYSLYKIAFLQFSLKRHNEAKTTSDIILKDSKSEEFTVVFKPSRNKNEEVSMKAAILNLRGLIAKEEGNKEEARKFFNDAINQGKEFTFAKENLESLDK